MRSKLRGLKKAIKKAINVKSKKTCQSSSLMQEIDNCYFYNNLLARTKESIKETNNFDINKSFYNFFANLASQSLGQLLSQTSCQLIGNLFSQFRCYSCFFQSKILNQ